MLTVDQIKIILSDRNLSKVAIESEVSAASILKEDSKPLYETVKKLSDYLEASK
jgi:hypothetical protein